MILKSIRKGFNKAKDIPTLPNNLINLHYSIPIRILRFIGPPGAGRPNQGLFFNILKQEH